MSLAQQLPGAQEDQQKEIQKSKALFLEVVRLANEQKRLEAEMAKIVQFTAANGSDLQAKIDAITLAVRDLQNRQQVIKYKIFFFLAL